MNQTNKKIACPCCCSHNLFRFEKDKKEIKNINTNSVKDNLHHRLRQKKRQLKNYPRCPVCNKGTFIHHNYSNYINYRCNDKKRNHSFFVAKPTAIDP